MAHTGLQWFDVRDFWLAGPSQRGKDMETVESSMTKLLQTICTTPSHVDHAAEKPQNELALSAFILGYLKNFPWLEVMADELPEDRYNIFASDVDEKDIELLVLSHMDTAGILENWSVRPGATMNGKFYGAGVGNAKGAMSALLEAMHRAGPTKGVGYLFYCDAEYGMRGMDSFLETHPNVRPRIALSTSGPSASLLTSCRGLLEFQICMRGVGAHVSRNDLGCSAIEALNHVMIGLARFCGQAQNNEPWPTSFNIAAVKGGVQELFGDDAHPLARYATADRLPDEARAHISILTGSPKLNRSAVEAQMYYLMDSFNSPRRENQHAFMEDPRFLHVRDGFSATEQEISDIAECFNEVHQGRRTQPGAYDYTDAAELVARRETRLACISPFKGNERDADEFVELNGLVAYRQACARLLSRFSARL